MSLLSGLESVQLGKVENFYSVTAFYIRDPNMLLVPLIGLEIGGQLLVVTDQFVYNHQYQLWRIKFFNELTLTDAYRSITPPCLPLDVVLAHTIRLVGLPKEADDCPIYYDCGVGCNPNLVYTLRYRDTNNNANIIRFMNGFAGRDTIPQVEDPRLITLSYLLHPPPPPIKSQLDEQLQELFKYTECEITVTGDLVKFNLPDSSSSLTMKIVHDSQPQSVFDDGYNTGTDDA